MVDRKTVDHCYALIEDAVAKGAKLLAGGETTDNVLMPAHLVDHVTPDMKLFRDESFGPVVGMIRARDEAHAIELANDTEYGLSSAVFTRDTARGIKVARQIHSGICHVNARPCSDEPQMPFGGIKASGYGRFGGKAGIDASPNCAGSRSRPSPAITRSDEDPGLHHRRGAGGPAARPPAARRGHRVRGARAAERPITCSAASAPACSNRSPSG